ncbi:hypothetical protein ACTXT7_007300 [Hymenolepis weldensis]
MPQARENCIVNALLTRSEHLSEVNLMSTKTTQENRSMRAKQIEAPRRTEVSLVLLPRKQLPLERKFIRINGMREGHIMTPPALPQGLRVNADAVAHVETIQTFVGKPSWIDNVASGGKPCIPTRFGSIL